MKSTLSVSNNKYVDLGRVLGLKEVLFDLDLNVMYLFPSDSLDKLYDYLPFDITDNFIVTKSSGALILRMKKKVK